MAKGVISSFNRFKELFPHLEKENTNRYKALKFYLDKGGVISLKIEEDGQNDKSLSWPKLAYPDHEKLREKYEFLVKDKKKLDLEFSFLQKTIYNMKQDKSLAKIKKYADPLFWEHLSKYVLDSDYRGKSETVQLPFDLLQDKKYRPMINEFVKNSDYRQTLSDTVSTSIIYKDRKIASKAEGDFKSRVEVFEKKLLDMQKKLYILDEEVKAWKAMLDWSLE